MLTFLLIIIYLAFINLGLPDSLLGSAWPTMRLDLNMPLSAAGIVSMLITGATIISSFLSGRVVKRFGTGIVTFVSVLLTALSILGFSVTSSFYWLLILAVPLGLGGGAVDSALNNFVALNYKAKHMSWLHCFWGIGATAGPYIMSMFLSERSGWRRGALTISIVQFSVLIVLFFTLPLWKKAIPAPVDIPCDSSDKSKKVNLYSIPHVRIVLVSFFCCCAIEATTGLWGSSFLVNSKGIPSDQAARWVSTFYLAITIGRLLSGFVLVKLSSANLIRIGQILIAVGILMFILPLQFPAYMLGFIFIGLGCAPIFPCMLHDTPKRVGNNLSQSMIGIQMAFAYMGSTVLPPIFGFLASAFGTSILPVYLLLQLGIMFFSLEKTNRLLKAERN